MDPEVHIVEAQTEAHFAAMSRIHALGWRAAYPDAVPAQWMEEHITDDRWVDLFRQYAADGVYHGLLSSGGTPRSPVSLTAPPGQTPGFRRAACAASTVRTTRAGGN